MSHAATYDLHVGCVNSGHRMGRAQAKNAGAREPKWQPADVVRCRRALPPQTVEVRRSRALFGEGVVPAAAVTVRTCCHHRLAGFRRAVVPCGRPGEAPPPRMGLPDEPGSDPVALVNALPHCTGGNRTAADGVVPYGHYAAALVNSPVRSIWWDRRRSARGRNDISAPWPNPVVEAVPRWKDALVIAGAARLPLRSGASCELGGECGVSVSRAAAVVCVLLVAAVGCGNGGGAGASHAGKRSAAPGVYAVCCAGGVPSGPAPGRARRHRRHVRARRPAGPARGKRIRACPPPGRTPGSTARAAPMCGKHLNETPDTPLIAGARGRSSGK